MGFAQTCKIKMPVGTKKLRTEVSSEPIQQFLQQKNPKENLQKT